MAHLKTTVLILITFLVNSVNVAGDQTYTVHTYGDPIIQNLDKESYSFEGQGEFVFLRTATFDVQIRTEFASQENHAAAYITALGIQESGAKIEIHNNRSTEQLVVFENGKYLCNSSQEPIRPCHGSSKVIMIVTGKINGSDDKVAIVQSAGFRSNFKKFTVAYGRGLDINIGIRTEMDYSDVKGLAGGLVNGSFILRNGTLRQPNTTKEYYYCADTWRVIDENESIFTYTLTSGSYDTYNNRTQIPTFLEDLLDNVTLLFNYRVHHTEEEIKKFTLTCNGNKDCLLAIARTDDIKEGQAILDKIAKAEYAANYKANSPPVFLPNITTQIKLDLRNKSYELDLKQYARVNNTNDKLEFTIDTTIPKEQYSFDDGVFTWTISTALRNITAESFGLTFRVVDPYDKDNTSHLNVIFCGCENASQCNYNSTSDSGPKFKTASCECGKKSKGLYCETKIPICNVTTCYEQHKCNNSAPEDNPCAPCPMGYGGTGLTCNDIDECLTGDSDCSQPRNCDNVDGSYFCSCDAGYTLSTDNHTCEDDDECLITPDTCSSEANTKCHNTEGSFACMCVKGFYKNKDGACKSEITVGRYKYYSEVTFSPRNRVDPEMIKAMNHIQKQQLKQNFTNILTDLLVGNKTASVSFSFITITLIEYVGDTDRPIRIARDISSTQQSPGFHIEYTLHSKESLNSTQVKEKLNEAVSTHGSSPSNVIINGNSFTLASATEESFKIVDDSKNPICTDNNTVKTCDLKTTECKANRGLYKCQCRPGYMESPDSDKYCIDINECETEDMASRCVHGKCINTPRGSWKCTCPDSPYNASSSRHVGNDTYRCEGDFQYFGSMSFWLSGQMLDKKTLVKFARDKIQAVYNESNDRKDGIFPAMKDIYKDVEIDNISSTNVVDNPIVKIDIQFILHVGESVSTEWIATFPNETAIGVNTMIGVNLIINMDISIYSDSQKNVCNIPGKTKCHISSTNCEGSNGKYICTCKDGYEATYSGYVCADIDECGLHDNRCTNGTCVNSPAGSWSCSCKNGYEPTFIDENNHTQSCQNINECEHYTCVNGKCVDTVGDWRCNCSKGYKNVKSGELYVCNDIDECGLHDNRCTNGTCVNSPAGSWSCSCKNGYEPTFIDENNHTQSCQNINECEHYTCVNGKCVDTVGDWRCNCSKGYKNVKSGELYVCNDINETTDRNYICSGGRIVNSVGSWKCECPKGRQPKVKNDYQIDCEDINECNNRSYVCKGVHNSSKCTNIENGGGWTCDCMDGFNAENLTVEFRQCVDKDECSNGEGKCEGGTCINTVGHWYCQCPKGFENTSNSNMCKDIDECVVSNGSACRNAISCDNTLGSWTCKCDDRLKLKDVNKSTKICEGELQFLGSVSILIIDGPNVNKEDIKKALEEQLTDTFKKSLEKDPSVFVEVIRVYEANRMKRDAPTSYTVDYIVHTDTNVSFNEIKNATAEVLKPNSTPSSSKTFHLLYINAKTFDDDTICLTPETNVCNSNTSTCAYQDGIVRCDCKKGYEKPPGNLNSYECQNVNECKRQSPKACSKGVACTDTDGSWTCKCEDGYKDVEHNGQKECQDVCDTKKCIEEEECKHANNTDGYICRCKVGWTGQYCDEKIKEEETKSDESNLQTIAIATGTSLGGLVLILAVVVLVVCRLRSQKAKEAEQLASGRINNGFNGFDGSFHGQNYITDNKTGFYNTESINDGRRNNRNEYIANPVYSKPNKTGRLPSPRPDYEADRINPNSLRPARVLPNRADIDRRIPSPDYDPPRDYGSERLNVSHDSRMNGYAQNGSLDRNYRRGRHNN